MVFETGMRGAPNEAVMTARPGETFSLESLDLIWHGLLGLDGGTEGRSNERLIPLRATIAKSKQ